MHQINSIRIIVIALVVAAAATIAPASAANDRLTRTQTLLSVFAQTCLANAGSPKQLLAQSSPSGTKPLTALSPAHAVPFLRGHTGHVWALPRSAGRAVIVSRDDGQCSLFARRWTGVNIEGHIQALFGDVDIFKLKEARRIDGPLSMVSYDLIPTGSYLEKLKTIGNPKSSQAFSLIATTDRSPKAVSQLAISLSAASH